VELVEIHTYDVKWNKRQQVTHEIEASPDGGDYRLLDTLTALLGIAKKKELIGDRKHSSRDR
jgi:hypothetical protein